MILNHLCDYYERKRALGELVDDAFERKAIPFIITLDEKGRFVQLVSTTLTKEEKRAGKQEILFTIPKGYANRSGTQSYKKPNCLWDHSGFVLRDYKDDPDPGKVEKNRARAEKQHEHFRYLVNELAETSNDSQILAVKAFLDSEEEKKKVVKSDDWEMVLKSANKNMTFKIVGYDHLVCESQPAQAWAKDNAIRDASDLSESTCLITGDRGPICRLHPPIKGVQNTMAAGAAIASFESSPLSSYGLDGSENAPVSVQKAQEYGIALNHLLRKGSPNRFYLHDMTMVCWAEKGSALESMIPNQFTFGPQQTDNPDAGVEQVKAAVDALHAKGRDSAEGSQKFFLLGLKGANGRVSVQYWQQATAYDIGETIRIWLNDLSLPSDKFGTFTPSLVQIAKAISLNGDLKHAPPRLISEMIRAIFENRRLPESLIKSVLTRNKAERRVSTTRAAVLKAYLSREARLNNTPEMEISMSFNLEGKPIGYKLGALLAVYEKIQYDAHKGSVIGTNVKDRFFASLSTRPTSVLGTLSRLSENHIKKLGRKGFGFGVALQKLRDDVMAEIDVDALPGYLGAKEQSYFAVGYYQQRQEFFKKIAKNTQPKKGELHESV